MFGLFGGVMFGFGVCKVCIRLIFDMLLIVEWWIFDIIVYEFFGMFGMLLSFLIMVIFYGGWDRLSGWVNRCVV